jgi:hypothetical protein
MGEGLPVLRLRGGGAVEQHLLDNRSVEKKLIARFQVWDAAGFGLFSQPPDRDADPAGHESQCQKFRGFSFDHAADSVAFTRTSTGNYPVTIP